MIVLTNASASTGVTSIQAIAEQNGGVFTEAFTGVYLSSGGCSNGGPIHEGGSTLSATTTQTWANSAVNVAPVDNAGVEPIGIEFPY